MRRSFRFRDFTLCAVSMGVVLSLLTPITASAALRSEAIFSVAKLDALLTRMNIASTKVREITVLLSGITPSPKEKKELSQAQQSEKKARAAFASAINSALNANPVSAGLVNKYVTTLNEVDVAKQSLTRSLLSLRSDQAILQNTQKALNAVVTGGQSDMNSELGADREIIKETSRKILQDQADIALVKSEVSLAQLKFGAAEGAAKANPLASMAIIARANIGKRS